MSKSTKIMLTLPIVLKQRAESQAGLYGLKLAEYIRYVLVKELEEAQKDVEFLDEDDPLHHELVESMEEYKRGNYYVYDPVTNTRKKHTEKNEK